MKRIITPFECAADICNAMSKGILLTTKAEGKVNTMTIGWGKLGIEWGRPIFIAYVRHSRHTREMLDQNGEFTVNVPLGEIDGRILGFCGTKSGRDLDKIRELGLTLEEPLDISVPGIRELPLTLECKVIYKQKQDMAAIPADIQDRYYPASGEPVLDGCHQDFHYAYYGQIVNAYIIEK